MHNPPPPHPNHSSPQINHNNRHSPALTQEVEQRLLQISHHVHAGHWWVWCYSLLSDVGRRRGPLSINVVRFQRPNPGLISTRKRWSHSRAADPVQGGFGPGCLPVSHSYQILRVKYYPVCPTQTAWQCCICQTLTVRLAETRLGTTKGGTRSHCLRSSLSLLSICLRRAGWLVSSRLSSFHCTTSKQKKCSLRLAREERGSASVLLKFPFP